MKTFSPSTINERIDEYKSIVAKIPQEERAAFFHFMQTVLLYDINANLEDMSKQITNLNDKLEKQ